MSRFENEEIKPALVVALVAMAKFSACGDQDIIEIYKKAFGNSWESTYLESAITALKESMLGTLNNGQLIDTFMATSEVLKKAYPEKMFPRSEEIDAVVRKFSHAEEKLEVRNYEVVSELGSTNGSVEKVLYRNGVFERLFVRKSRNNLGNERERFACEIVVIAKLQHPGVVSIVDAEFTAQRAWYVMDFIEGTNLRDYRGPADGKYELILKLLEALSFLHKNNIIHGDLKPDNILVRNIDHQPIIVDFGYAYNQQKTVTIMEPDTTQYTAPEVQADPERRSLPASDIYTCGVMAYELFCNRSPERENYISIGDGFEKIDKIIERAIQFRSADRYQSIEKMRDAWSETRLNSSAVWFQADMFR